jgi:hypothetical protein
LKGRLLLNDTAWFDQRITIPYSTVFEKISGPLLNRQASFADSAQYALLYVYRPVKTMLLLATYPLYLNNELMCIVRNKSGYIFKVKREGHYTLRTQLLKDESHIDIDVKFGNKYYVMPLIDWGVKTHLYNFKLRLEQPADAGTAQQAFEQVNLRQVASQIPKMLFSDRGG